MRNGLLRGIASRALLIGVSLCASATSVHVHAQPAAVRTVGVYIVVPGDAKDANEVVRPSEIKRNLEWLIKQQLEALGGIEVKVKPTSSELSKAGSRPDPWLRDNSIQYYLTGEISFPLGFERSFMWRVQNVRATDPKTSSRGLASNNNVRTINNVDSKRTMEDLLNAALQVREVFAKSLGISRTKRVLVSCFQIAAEPRAKDDAAILQMLQMSLPNQLPAYLQEVLGNKGYETRGLDPTQILTFCKFQGNAAKGSLEDEKSEADCVIEGMIRMSSAEFVEVTFAARWGRVPVRMEPFHGRISEPRIQKVMADFIAERWSQIERAQ